MSDEGKQVKFSIIIPSYNQEKFIRETMNSIRNQNYDNIEIIVVDGGSTDDTVSILKNEYSDIISTLISEPDAGQSDALNKGFALATGDIMGWMNSDDIYVASAFENAGKIFEAQPQVDVVFGDWLEISEDGNVLRREFAFDFSRLQTVYEGAQMNCQAMFWRRDVQRRFSGFDLALHTSMDYQFLVEISLMLPERSFQRVPNALGAFRRYEGQKTDGSQYDVYLNEHRYISEKYHCFQKLSVIGYLLKITLKIRRLLWYIKRGGFIYTLNRWKHRNSPFRRDIL